MENLQVTFQPGKTVRIDGNAPRPHFASTGIPTPTVTPAVATNGQTNGSVPKPQPR